DVEVRTKGIGSLRCSLTFNKRKQHGDFCIATLHQLYRKFPHCSATQKIPHDTFILAANPCKRNSKIISCLQLSVILEDTQTPALLVERVCMRFRTFLKCVE